LPSWLPVVKDWKSKMFWTSFWLGGLFVLNLQVVIGKEMQPLHWVVYYLEPFLMIYLVDLGLEIWLKVRSKEFSAFAKQRMCSIAAIVIFVVGVGLTVFRLNLASVAQMEYSRRDNKFEELITSIKQQSSDLIILTSDRYLNRILPGYVRQRFLVPIWNDPMTNRELRVLEDTSARILGYMSWNEMNAVLYGIDVSEQKKSSIESLAIDNKKIIVILNRHQENRVQLRSVDLILVNEDFEVGFLDEKRVRDKSI